MDEAHAIIAHSHEGVSTLELNSPDDGNILTPPTLYGLIEALKEAVAGGARAIVLTGRGRNFSLGANADSLRSLAVKGDSAAEDVRLLSRAVHELWRCPIPVVAAVNGQAAGAGFGLALGCDIRLADTSTRFNFAYAALGLTPDAGMSWLLPRVVGQAAALELLLMQPILRPDRALELGLVSDIAADDGVLLSSQRLARQIASHAPGSVKAVKHLVRAAPTATFPVHAEHEGRLFLREVQTRNAVVPTASSRRRGMA